MYKNALGPPLSLVLGPLKRWRSVRTCLTSLAMVVMKAGGRAVAMRERAWRAERAESAGGLRGKPMVIL